MVSAVFGPVVTTARVMGIVESVTRPDHIATAAELLMVEHGVDCEVDDTCIRITDEVRGDPVVAVLRAIGLAQDAPAVGATAAGPKGSAFAVWRAPYVAMVHRTPKARRVALYKLKGRLLPNDYAYSDGHLPSQFEEGNWYGDDVPEHVHELLLEGGVLLEDT